MPYNYRRGHQMVIFDPRITDLNGPVPVVARPPGAYNTWTLNMNADGAMSIFNWARIVATGVPGGRGLDAVHVIGHGNASIVQLGRDYVDGRNAAQVFGQIKGKTRWIVFWSCLVGSDQTGTWRGAPQTFGDKVARAANANVVVAREVQVAHLRPPHNTVDFGEFEGPVDVYTPRGERWTYQDHNPHRATPRVPLEPMIFR